MSSILTEGLGVAFFTAAWSRLSLIKFTHPRNILIVYYYWYDCTAGRETEQGLHYSVSVIVVLD